MADAVIWGASGGIGRALVTRLKNEGWRVLAAARHEDGVPPAADLRCHFDAQRPDSVRDAAMLMAQHSDGVALMVYAAGGITAAPLDVLSPQDWARTLAANLTGPYLVAHHALSLMNEGGQVVFIGAHVDRVTLPKFGAYASAKAGLETLVGVLQKEHRRLKFSLVRPPAVATPFWDSVPFSLPKGALSAEAVAQAVMARYHAGEQGVLDL
jgi:NAD(P)-dependent dehydrogenase (short-subunit alcohol dehydrogenase family)